MAPNITKDKLQQFLKQGLSQSEIAWCTGIPRSTLRKRIKGLYRKFSFEAICGMLSLRDQRYITREQDDGDQFQRGPFP